MNTRHVLAVMGIMLCALLALQLSLGDTDSPPPRSDPDSATATPAVGSVSTPDDAARSEAVSPTSVASTSFAPWIEALEPSPSEAKGPEPLAGRHAVLAGRLAWRDDDTPLTGATVRLTPVLLDRVLPPDRDTLTPGDSFFLPEDVVTDRYGMFEFVDVPGQRQLSLHITHGEHTVMIYPLQRLPQRGERIELGDIRVERRGSITGTIVSTLKNPDGDPPGARASIFNDTIFRALSMDERFLSARARQMRHFKKGGWLDRQYIGKALTKRFGYLPIVSADTDQNGRFLLQGIVPGENWLTVRTEQDEGTLQRRVIAVAGLVTDIGSVAMEETVPVMIRSKPERRAMVLLTSSSLNARPFWTDAQGHASIQLPRSTLENDNREIGYRVRGRAVEAWCDPIRGRIQTKTHPKTKHIENVLELQIPREQHYRVTLMADVPIHVAKTRVQTWPSDGTPARTFGHQPDHGKTQSARAEDLQSSDSQLTHWVLRGTAGATEVFITSPGFAPKIARFYPTKEGVSGLSHHLEPGITTTVRVVDENNTSIAGAAVRVQLPLDRLPWTRRNRLTLGATDAAGDLTLTNFWSGELRFLVDHPDHGRTEVTATAEDGAVITVVLRPTATLRGLISTDAQNTSTTRWFATLAQRDQPDVPSRRVLTGTDGRFEFQDLSPGRYLLSTELPDTPIRGIEAQLQRYKQPSQPVDLAAGDVKHVDFYVGGDSWQQPPILTGRVRRNGVDAIGVWVRLITDRYQPWVAPALTDTFGQFKIYSTASRAVLGNEILEVRTETYGQSLPIARVPADSLREIDLDIPTGSIHVSLGDQAPRRMFRLIPTDKDSTIPDITLVADRFGALRAEGIPAATFYIQDIAFDTETLSDTGRPRSVYGPIVVPQGKTLILNVETTRRDAIAEDMPPPPNDSSKDGKRRRKQRITVGRTR